MHACHGHIITNPVCIQYPNTLYTPPAWGMNFIPILKFTINFGVYLYYRKFILWHQTGFITSVCERYGIILFEYNATSSHLIHAQIASFSSCMVAVNKRMDQVLCIQVINFKVNCDHICLSIIIYYNIMISIVSIVSIR